MAGSNGNFPASLPVLDGKNWDRWRIQIKVIFGFQDVLETVLSGSAVSLGANPTEEEKLANREAKKKECKALFLIHQCVDPANFEKISSAITAKEAWETLEKSYGAAEKLKRVKLQTLRRQYELLQMENSDTVSTYFTKLLTIINQMCSNGETTSDQMVVEKVLRSLSSRFDHVVVAIEEAKDLSAMKIDELQGSLEAHEQRMNSRDTERGSDQAQSGKRTWSNKSNQQWKNGKAKESSSSCSSSGVQDNSGIRAW